MVRHSSCLIHKTLFSMPLGLKRPYLAISVIIGVGLLIFVVFSKTRNTKNEDLVELEREFEENLKHSVPNYRKEECCEFGKGKSLSTLCGEKDERSLDNNKVVVSPERSCVCVDFMYCKMVFVTGASNNHFSESLDSIASVQNLMPGSPIIYYDIGLYSGWFSDQVSRIKTFCNLEYRQLEMKKYSAHVAKLSTYAFKVAIISEALKEHEIVFWIDASIRFHHPVPESILTDLMGFPFLACQLGSPNGYFTDDTTFNFLKVDRAKFGHVKQIEGCMLLFRNSTYLQKHIFQPWVDCAMEKQCIAADGITNHGCDLNEMRIIFERETESGSINPIFYGCHRFDQSALSTILGGEFGEKDSLYARSFYDFLTVFRWPTSMFEPCIRTLNPY